MQVKPFSKNKFAQDNTKFRDPQSEDPAQDVSIYKFSDSQQGKPRKYNTMDKDDSNLEEVPANWANEAFGPNHLDYCMPTFKYKH